MALLTGGTTAQTSLSALLIDRSGSTTVTQNDALFGVAVKDDTVPGAHSVWPGAFMRGHLLYVPRRGVLKCFAGDYVMVDSTGWPILVSSYAIASGPWQHS